MGSTSNNESPSDKLQTILNTNDKNTQSELYEEYVKEVTPTKSLPANMIKAFFVGGAICCLGQLLINIFIDQGMNDDDAAMWTSICLILLSVISTGFGLYSKLGEFAGAGSLVPITGFANSVAASAIEFKKEGQVFGIGCKIFTIAGPVILYGIFVSWILGIIYWLFQL
jgi:stage V sporulation protein AC